RCRRNGPRPFQRRRKRYAGEDRLTAMTNIFSPFDPDDAPGRRRLRQLRFVPLRMILPNVITLLALCAGLTSIRMSIEGRYDYAIAAIAIAAALDGIAGRRARFLRSSPRSAAELYSLTDVANFAVAPGINLDTRPHHDV